MRAVAFSSTSPHLALIPNTSVEETIIGNIYIKTMILMINASNNDTISGFENHVDVLRVPRAPYSLESRLDKCLKRLERCINEHQPDIRRPF
jgi:hypothetical protein